MRVPGTWMWRRSSFSVKFALIIFVTGLAIAILPLTLARSEAQRQAQGRAADKAGLVGAVVTSERQSLQQFVAALAVQVGPPIKSGDSAALLDSLQRDSTVNGATDIVGVTDTREPVLVQGSTRIVDPVVVQEVSAAALSGASTLSDTRGQPWLIATAKVTDGTVAVVARPFDPRSLAVLRGNSAASGDTSDLAIAHNGRWAIAGTVAGVPVHAGEAVDPSVMRLIGGTNASIVNLAGRDIAVNAIQLGSGFSLVVSMVVGDVTSFWEPALLLIAVILVAMLFIIVIVQTDLQGPLSRLDRAVAALGRGDLDVEIPAGRESEIGRLSASFDVMRKQMRATIHSNAARAAIASELNAAQPLETALQRVAADLRSSTSSAAGLIIVGGTEMNDSFVVVAGSPNGDVDADALLGGGGPIGTVFRESPSRAAELGAASASPEAAIGLRELCIAPLRLGRQTLGVVVIADRPGGFLPPQRDLVDSAAEQVALALERYRFLAMVQRQASIDDLTGLYNHRFMVDYLGQQIALAERLGTPLAILMCDLDHFKNLNDAYGHHVGDQALRRFAETLLASIRRADLAARYGGEEFVVVMANTGRKEALLVAEKIRAAVASVAVTVEERAVPLYITVSIGGAAFPDDTTSARELLIIADRALYSAKRAGRNRVAMAAVDTVRAPERDLGGSPQQRRTHDAVGGQSRSPE